MQVHQVEAALVVVLFTLWVIRAGGAIKRRLQELPHVERAIMLFDDRCVMCNGFVDFCIARNPRCALKVAGLESEVGRWLCRVHSVKRPPSSFVYIEEMAASPGAAQDVPHYRVFQKSDAALRSLSALSSSRAWMLIIAFEMAPAVVRDFVYDLGWRYRRTLFGTTACRRRGQHDLQPHEMERRADVAALAPSAARFAPRAAPPTAGALRTATM